MRQDVDVTTGEVVVREPTPDEVRELLRMSNMGLRTTADTTPATLHFARTESGAHTWTVNGGAYNVAATLDAESGLYWSEVTVQTPTGSASGEEVTVTVDGETLTLRTP
jgi:hypothetical protein